MLVLIIKKSYFGESQTALLYLTVGDTERPSSRSPILLLSDSSYRVGVYSVIILKTGFRLLSQACQQSFSYYVIFAFLKIIAISCCSFCQ